MISSAPVDLYFSRWEANSRSTISRFRCRTCAMSVITGPVIVPKFAACCAKWATRALQISFLLGMQAMFGQEPPTHRRSTATVRRPDCAICHASSFPPWPLPNTKTSTCSVTGIASLLSDYATAPFLDFGCDNHDVSGRCLDLRLDVGKRICADAAIRTPMTSEE